MNWTEIILYAVWVFGAVGGISFVASCIGMRQDEKVFNDFKKEYATNDVMDREKLLAILNAEEAVRRDTVVGRRVENILLALARNKSESGDNERAGATRKAVAPPQMQDLHRMTQQLVYSRFWPSVLRVCSSVLLIVGICGTLWGVHEVLDTAHFDIKEMPAALAPSKWAVFLTIILVILRSIFSAMVDRSIWQLDRLTMMHILPDLLPASDINVALGKFTETVNSLNGQMEGMKKNADDLEKITDDFSSGVEAFKRAAEEFGAFVAMSRQKVEGKQKELADGMAAGRDMMGKMEQKLNAIEQFQQSTENSVHDLSEQMQQVSTDAEKLSGVAGTMTDYVAKVGGLKTALDDASAVLAQHRSTLTSIENAERKISEDKESMEVSMETIQKEVARLDEQARKLSLIAKTAEDQTGETENLVRALNVETGKLSTIVEGSVRIAKTLSDNIDKDNGDVNAKHVVVKKSIEKIENRVKDILANLRGQKNTDSSQS